MAREGGRGERRGIQFSFVYLLVVLLFVRTVSVFFLPVNNDLRFLAPNGLLPPPMVTGSQMLMYPDTSGETRAELGSVVFVCVSLVCP